MPKGRTLLRFLFLCLVLAGYPAPAFAQTYDVTTTADCTGCGSLRDALTSASSGTGHGTINLRAVSGTIVLSDSYTLTRTIDWVGNGNITISGAAGVRIRIDNDIIARPTVMDVSFGDIEINLVGSTRWVTATSSVLTPQTRLLLENGGGILVGSTSQFAATVTHSGLMRFGDNGVLTAGGTGEDFRFRISNDGEATGIFRKVGTGTLHLHGSSYPPTVVVDGGVLVLAPGTDGFHAFTGSIVNNTELQLRTNLGSGSGEGCCGNPPFHISGTGSVHKWGTGRWDLFGVVNHTGGTFIHQGILRSIGAGLTGSIVNNGELWVEGFGTTTTFSGSVTGTGRVLLTPFGTITLTGTLSHTGQTEIGNGTLRVDQANSLSGVSPLFINHLGTLQVNASQEVGSLSGTTRGTIQLAAGTALTVNQTGSSTYSGLISGAGGLVKSGSGTLVLNGSSSHTGGTTVLAGTLAGSTFTLRDSILNHAIVSFNQGSGGTASASISGTGHVIFDNRSYTLTGTNTYTGGTTLNGGSLSGTAMSIQGDIANFGTVRFDQETNGIYSGSMSGTGSFVKALSGTLTVTGANTYGGGTTILSGTLAGTTSSLQGLIDNRSSLVFDQGSSGTFVGAISGSGSVTKTGSGTVTLNGPQSYSGGTFVLAGTLAGDTLSLRGAIVNDATVEFWQQGAGTFSGLLSGSGRVVKTGAGTLTFGGANTYSGGTIIADGVLAIAGDASLGRADGAVTFDGGELRLGGGWASSRAITFGGTGTIDTNGFDAVLSGALSGPGRFTKAGAGMLVLTGMSSRSGETIISAGILAGNTANLTGRITNHALLIFDQTAAGTFAGTISGTGSVVKQGTGTLTFTGSQTYTGLTDLAAGRLVLGGGLGGTLFARDGTFFRAAPAVAGTPIAIGGDLLLARAATYETPLSASGAVGPLHVTGAAVIDGTTLALLPAAGAGAGPSRVSTSLLLRAASIDGGFGSITGLGGAFDPYLIRRGNELHLHLIRAGIDFQHYASSANGVALGAALLPLQATAGGDLAFVLRELRSLGTDAELATALDQIAGSGHASAAGAGLLQAAEIADIVGLRFTGRSGPWMQALGAVRALDEATDPSAASSTSRGTLVGYDWGRARLRAGIAAGYTRDDIDAFGDRDRVNGVAYRGAVYGEAGAGRWFASAILSAARHKVEGDRAMSFVARLPETLGSSVLFGGVTRQAEFSFDALEWSGTIESGLRAAARGFDIRASAGLQAARLSRDAFDETGADSLSLRFGDLDTRSQTMRLRVMTERSAGRVRPRADVRYARELGSRGIRLDAAIAGAPFTIDAFQLPRDSVSARAGVAVGFGAVSLTADYRFAAASGLRQHLISIGIGR